VHNVARHHARTERRTLQRTRSHRYQLEALDMNAARTEEHPAAQVDSEIRTLIMNALGKLDEAHRIPLVMHYIEGMTQQEVGKLTGVSQSMIARRIAQGLEILRVRMSQSGVAVTALA